MNNPNIYIPICDLIESKINVIINKINQTHSIFDGDKLYSELRILDWILYQVCRDQQKKLVTNVYQ